MSMRAKHIKCLLTFWEFFECLSFFLVPFYWLLLFMLALCVLYSILLILILFCIYVLWFFFSFFEFCSLFCIYAKRLSFSHGINKLLKNIMNNSCECKPQKTKNEFCFLQSRPDFHRKKHVCENRTTNCKIDKMWAETPIERYKKTLKRR